MASWFIPVRLSEECVLTAGQECARDTSRTGRADYGTSNGRRGKEEGCRHWAVAAKQHELVTAAYSACSGMVPNVVGVEHGSSSKAMSPMGLATPSAFKSLKPNSFGSIRCDGATFDSAEKMLSTRPGNFLSHSRIKPLICLRCRFSCEPHRSHGMMGKPLTSA